MNTQRFITRSALALPALSLAALLATTTVQARPPGDDDHHWRFGPPGAEMQLARLDEELGLSDEQAVRLLEVLQAAEAERADLHARVMEQMKPEICALMQGTEEEILAILTPEQAVAFADLKAQREQRLARHHGERMGMPDCGTADD